MRRGESKMKRDFGGIDDALKDGCSLLMLRTSPFNAVRNVQIYGKGQSMLVSVAAFDLVLGMNVASEIYHNTKEGSHKGDFGNPSSVDKVDAWVLANQEVHGKYRDGQVVLEAVSIHTDRAEASSTGATVQEAYAGLERSLVGKI